MNNYGTPTIEQVAALRRFANSRGRTWKSKLNQCWETGHYGFADQTDLLQQVRNDLGPSWLMKFKFTHPAL